MKKILLLASIVLISQSCDVLDVKPQSDIQANEVYKNKEGIEKGILGSYSAFQSLSYYGRSYLIFSDLSADNLDHPSAATSTEYAQVDNNAILPENASVAGIWSSIYAGINYANNVIAQVPLMSDMTDAEKNKALGELYFIRALNHFNLVNYFGAIPIKIQPTVGTKNLDVPRDAVSKVYDQIISDLLLAEQYLPESSLKVRASKYAATALLARVYLYKGAYQQASAKATDVIENGGYSIIDFDEVFTDQSSESIFEIDFTNLNRNRIAEYNFPKSLNGRREVAPNAGLISAFASSDLRLGATIAYDGTAAYANKYHDLSVGADNVIVLRLAEMHLIRAESEAMLGGEVIDIQNDINILRNRADVSPTTAASASELLKVIEKERRLEFAFEGHRWFDLVRTKRAMVVLPNVTKDSKTLFPIPLEELVTNKDKGMIQNDGY